MIYVAHMSNVPWVQVSVQLDGQRGTTNQQKKGTRKQHFCLMGFSLLKSSRQNLLTMHSQVQLEAACTKQTPCTRLSMLDLREREPAVASSNRLLVSLCCILKKGHSKFRGCLGSRVGKKSIWKPSTSSTSASAWHAEKVSRFCGLSNSLMCELLG